MNATLPRALDSFRAGYAAYRATEGRAYRGAELRRLPYLATGPLAWQWAVRARSYDALIARAVRPLERDRPLEVLDLGAGNGWLSYRLAARGHRSTAVDVREDDVDGLGAAEELRRLFPFRAVIASFDALPLAGRTADLAVFNASLHYATDLAATLAEAERCVRPGGRMAILDSPFYDDEADGEAMVREKHWAVRAGELLPFECIEFLTRERLERASPLAWHRHRVRYPLWYELRPLVAWWRGVRRPSRFDLWLAEVR